MDAEQSKALRVPFPPEQIGKLPKAGTQLDYVGHAAVTDRLLAVDPEWSWEPMAFDADGGPMIRRDGKEATLWIWLTVCGVRRPGVGSCLPNAFELEKQLVSDALRNAAMRFGVALDLWSKEDLLHAEENRTAEREHRAAVERRQQMTAQKRELLSVCNGNGDLAKQLWGDRDGPMDPDEFAALLTRAEQMVGE